jgi:hypothetical protein
LEIMRIGWLLALAAAHMTAAAALSGAVAQTAEPLQFRWPSAAEAKVTQANVDKFGNFSFQFDLKAARTLDGTAIKVAASNYRLLYLNRKVLRGRKLDGFDIMTILHRLTIPTYLADNDGRLQSVEPPDPQEIKTAFLQNVSSRRVASLRRWYLERRPGDFDEVVLRSTDYWRPQIPYWEYWIGKWRSLFGPGADGLSGKRMLHLAGLQVPGQTHLLDRSPAPDCPTCIAVAAEDRFSRKDLAPYLEPLAEHLALTREPGASAMTGMRAYVRTEAIIDWQTMLPYRVQAMTIVFQDLADGRVESADQTKHFFFEWR